MMYVIVKRKMFAARQYPLEILGVNPTTSIFIFLSACWMNEWIHLEYTRVGARHIFTPLFIPIYSNKCEYLIKKKLGFQVLVSSFFPFLARALMGFMG